MVDEEIKLGEREFVFLSQVAMQSLKLKNIKLDQHSSSVKANGTRRDVNALKESLKFSCIYDVPLRLSSDRNSSLSNILIGPQKKQFQSYLAKTFKCSSFAMYRDDECNIELLCHPGKGKPVKKLLSTLQFEKIDFPDTIAPDDIFREFGDSFNETFISINTTGNLVVVGFPPKNHTSC